MFIFHTSTIYSILCIYVLSACRLLRVVDLPTLDGVLNHETVDGKHILRNIRPLSHLLRLARSVSGSSVHGELCTIHCVAVFSCAYNTKLERL
jgi:hypothetical protein